MADGSPCQRQLFQWFKVTLTLSTDIWQRNEEEVSLSIGVMINLQNSTFAYIQNIGIDYHNKIIVLGN